MQGMAHYTSLLFYLRALYILEILIHQYRDYMGFECVVTFEVSLDDKEFMVSVFKFQDMQITPVKLILILAREVSSLEKTV